MILISPVCYTNNQSLLLVKSQVGKVNFHRPTERDWRHNLVLNMNIDHPVSQRIARERIIAVLRVENAREGLKTVEALVGGGINAIELTLRTDGAFEAIGAVREAFPDLLLGVGTVLTEEQVKRTAAAGADFAVAPGLNADVVRAARAVDLPFGPGVVTPSEIEAAIALGCRILKFFPAETSGGLKHLKSMAAPYAHMNISFIPLGGLSLENMGQWLASPLICAIGGSWLAPPDTIASENWAQIEANAAAAVQTAAVARTSR